MPASAHSRVGSAASGADVAHDVGNQPQLDPAPPLAVAHRLGERVEDLAAVGAVGQWVPMVKWTSL